jgi:peptide deformylase
MNKILSLTRAGNPILREVMPKLAPEEIVSDTVRNLIANIRYTNQEKQYGMGLAAPQVGERYALSVIGIKPTPNRPNLEKFDQVIINPTYEGIGRRQGMWEGCQSVGSGDDILYAKALRFKKIAAEWTDGTGQHHKEVLSGFVAHVFQHETDHLNGILFVDRVRDTKTYMMADEYRERVAGERRNRAKN